MTVKITPDNFILKVDDISASTIDRIISVNITPDTTDPTPNPGDEYLFVVDSSKGGNVDVTSPNTLTALITQNGSTYTASTKVHGTAYGPCSISGHKNGDAATWIATAINFSVQPQTANIVVTNQPSPALAVDSTPGKKGDGPDKVTSLVVMATDDSNAPLPRVLIKYLIAYVNDAPAKMTGVFYDESGASLTVTPDTSPGTSAGYVSTFTGTDGKSTLYIGTNENPGYINIHVEGPSNVLDGGYIYIYKR